MSKIPLILRREYLTRVKKKSFIIMTILGPLFFAAMVIIPGWVASMSDSDEKTVAVIDHSGLYIDKINDTEIIKFEYIDPASEDNLRNDFAGSGYYAFLIISDNLLVNSNAIHLYSDVGITIDVRDQIINSLRGYLRSEKLGSYEMDGLDQIIDDINKVNINLTTIKLGDDGSENESSTEMAMIVSLVFALLTYMFVFIYGAQVMQGVMEEKTNRIIEVIVSSVKPFELMMGKIIGIALVALTQVTLWIVLTGIILSGVKMAFSSESDLASRMTGIEMATGNADATEAIAEQSNSFNYDKVMSNMESMNPVGTLILFLLYFLGGYMLYASLYAAIGAAVDNNTDTQQFMLPVTIPIILALYVAMAAFRNPHSDMVFWFSMIPFTSPIVMMARVPFDVPLWEIVLSLALLVAGFTFTTWFAGRVYRVGILIYGKKVTYKELWKWFRYSGK